jgi:hypothetical protein
MELTDDDARPWRIAAIESGSARAKPVEVEPAGPS